MEKPKALDNLNTAISRLEAWAESADYCQRTALSAVEEEGAANSAKNYRALAFLIREAGNNLGLVA